MTTSTSPVPTVSPAATRISATVPARLGVDVVLHLHGLEHEHRLAGLDGVARVDEHLHDRALHRRADRAVAAAPAAADRGRLRPRRAPAGAPAAAATDGASGSQSFTVNRLPSTSTGTVRSTSARAAAPSGSARRGRGVAAAAAANSDGRPPPRATSSSGCPRRSRGARAARCAPGSWCGCPSISSSSSARSMPGPGAVAVGRPHDELADEVVVVLRDGVALVVAAVPAHAGPGGDAQPGDRAGRGQEALRRVLGVDAALDRVAAAHDGVLGERQRLAVGDADLLGDEVELGDHLGDAVLDLEPGVHLEEEELAVLVEHLDGAGVHVAARRARPSPRPRPSRRGWRRRARRRATPR